MVNNLPTNIEDTGSIPDLGRSRKYWMKFMCCRACALQQETWETVHYVVSDSCDPMDYSLPGSSVYGILQARTLEWVAISFSRGSSWPRNRTQVSSIAGRFSTNWGGGGGVRTRKQIEQGGQRVEWLRLMGALIGSILPWLQHGFSATTEAIKTRSLRIATRVATALHTREKLMQQQRPSTGKKKF